MTRFLPAIIAFATTVPVSSWADEQTKDPAPDGKFAMLIKDVVERDEARVKIDLVEVSSHKVVVDLALSGHPHAEDCKLLWSPDSQRVAFYESHHRGGDTTVYFRNGSEFTESQLPDLGNCATSVQKRELKAQGVLKFIEGNTTPKEWLQSGALVVLNDQGWETNDGNLRGCTQTVTIAFDANHKASVQRVTNKKTKEY